MWTLKKKTIHQRDEHMTGFFFNNYSNYTIFTFVTGSYVEVCRADVHTNKNINKVLIYKAIEGQP